MTRKYTFDTFPFEDPQIGRALARALAALRWNDIAKTEPAVLPQENLPEQRAPEHRQEPITALDDTREQHDKL